METESPDHMYPVKSKHVTWRALEGESVLLNLETGIYFTLNGTGTTAWELFDGATSLVEIEQILCQRFDVEPEQARSDLAELTGELQREGLVRVHEKPASPSGAERS
jgi:hypothetical protein